MNAVALALALAIQSSDVGQSIERGLLERRSRLEASYHTAESTLASQNGRFTEAQISAVKNQITSAYQIWTTCLIWQSMKNGNVANIETAISKNMKICYDDRSRFILWAKLGVRGGGETISDPELTAMMQKYDDAQRNSMRSKLIGQTK